MFKKFLSICIDEFPETLEYTESNENATVVTTTVLKREIMCIPEENGEVDSIDGPQCTNYNLHKSHGDHVLDSCVQLVDEHLGDKYRRASRTIYGNRIPWKTNKLAEMKSAGLLHVSYWGNGALSAFASFMLTEETGLVEGDAAHEVSVPVIYLYEIHVAHAHRGHGLGRRLLERALCEGVARRVRRVRCDFFGVALTVFGDNTRARRLYEAIGFCRAPGSPAPAAPALRPTRHGRKRVVVARDPLYYVYCLHMP